MSYYFSTNIKEDSFLILGDMNGGVKAMSFHPKEKGPFKHVPERDLLHLRYSAILAVQNIILKIDFIEIKIFKKNFFKKFFKIKIKPKF